MIPIEALRSTRRIIVHGSCPDGRASAVILHAALPNVEVIEMAHNSAEHRALQPAPGVLFCDFVPWLPEQEPERRVLLNAWVKSGAIVLDHHKGAESIVRGFGDRGIFADETTEPGVSGAVLAYREVFLPMRDHIVPLSTWRGDYAGEVADFGAILADLVGIRDTWQRNSEHWQAACELSEVLRFIPLHDLLAMGLWRITELSEDLGPILYRKKMDAATDAARTALRTNIAGRSVAIISSVHLTSDVADVIGDEVDMVAGFDYIHTAEGVDLQWSLRSGGAVDVLPIAKANGGGGHSKAAGFMLPIVERGGTKIFGPDSPYAIAEITLAKGEG